MSLVTSVCLLVGTCLWLKSLSLQLTSLSAVCTESLSLEWTWRYSTSPCHRDRELALGVLLPDPSGLENVVQKTPSCPSGSQCGFRNGEAAFMWSCISASRAVLYCGDVPCQVGPVGHCPRGIPWGYWLLWNVLGLGFFFHLSWGKRKRNCV